MTLLSTWAYKEPWNYASDSVFFLESESRREVHKIPRLALPNKERQCETPVQSLKQATDLKVVDIVDIVILTFATFYRSQQDL